jgi:hypothetical protein
MLSMTRGIQKFLLGLLGSRIWRKKLKTYFFENFWKNFFSAMQKATSPKLGTHVDHNEEYVPVNLQLSSINFTAIKN